MEKILLSLLLLLTILNISAQRKPPGDKIKTKWAEAIDANNVLGEYPRPILVRSEWQNLNGLWEYAVLPIGKNEPTQFEGKILVPFAIESSLSGVQRELGKENELWYKRTFNISSKWKGKSVLLHFGAVDWKIVWLEPVNKKYITSVTTTPDIDNQKLKMKVATCGTTFGDVI